MRPPDIEDYSTYQEFEEAWERFREYCLHEAELRRDGQILEAEDVDE